MTTSEQDIVKMLEEKISEHAQKIQSLRLAMNALNGKQDETSSVRRGRKRGRKPGSKKIVAAVKKTIESTTNKKRANRKNQSGETFENTIVNLLQDGTPKTSRTLMDLYNKKTGKKLEANGFAARLAIIKKKGGIKSERNSNDGLQYITKA